MPISRDHKIWLVEAYSVHQSLRRVQRLFQRQFHNAEVPCLRAISQVVSTFRATGSVQNQRREYAPRVLTEQTRNRIVEHFENNPSTSTRKASGVLDISKSSVHRALKAKNLHPYKVIHVQKLQDRDRDARMNFATEVVRRVGQDMGPVSLGLFEST